MAISQVQLKGISAQPAALPLLFAFLVLSAAAQFVRAQPGPTAPASPFQPDLTPGYVLIEGDIQVRLDQYLLLVSGNPPEALFGDAVFWSGGVVPFDFVTSGQGAVSTLNQSRAIAAMAMIEERTGVDFRPATGGDPDRIRFQSSQFNNSPVGRIGGAQIVNIVSWDFPIVICHELYHALGYWHEQSRSDRAQFITINTNNICGSNQSTACTPGQPPGCCGCANAQGNCVSCVFNFNILPQASTWAPYDFDSFMHYPSWAFSCNNQDTITVNPPFAQWQNLIGQSDHFSHLDTLSCRGIYPRPGDRWMRSGVQTGNGNFFSPYNSVTAMYASMPSGGTLFIDPGTYNIPIVGVPQNQPITLRATFGPVVITSTP